MKQYLVELVWREPYRGMITSPPLLPVTYVLLNTEQHLSKSALQIREVLNANFFYSYLVSVQYSTKLNLSKVTVLTQQTAFWVKLSTIVHTIQKSLLWSSKVQKIQKSSKLYRECCNRQDLVKTAITNAAVEENQPETREGKRCNNDHECVICLW